MIRPCLLAVCFGVAAPAVALAQPGALKVVMAGPTGEVADLAEANEIRVVFSEPMVVLGRIPPKVEAPFFSIEPAVAGTFRWSGTTILIFTPDPTRPLPYATRYTVTVAPTATAVSGRRLAAPHAFSFRTPTVRLLATNWYRRNQRFNEPLIAALRFNQPVRASDVMAHLTLRYARHAWDRPSLPPEARQRLQAVDPSAGQRFDEKVALADAAARADGPVPVALAGTWDEKLFPRSPDLVVVQTTIVPPAESWIGVTLDEHLPSPAGSETPGVPQHYTIQAEPTFFVDGPRCAARCDPSGYNPITLRRATAIAEVRTAITVHDITGPGAPRRLPPSPTPRRAADPHDASDAVTLEEAGFDRQPPSSHFMVVLGRTLRAEDGQTLGYTWLGTIGNGHETAFTSFGDGHGVWERSGGLQLPFYARNFTDVMQWTVPVAPGDLMGKALELQQKKFRSVPPGEGLRRSLQVRPDRIQSFGLDLSRATTRGGGLVWAGIREGTPIPDAPVARERNIERSTLVQVTNLGVTVKDSPRSTLVFVTRLDNGEPVEGARVSMIDRENQTTWTGTTDADGLVLGPGAPPRRSSYWDMNRVDFLVFAEKDADVAYALSNWQEGISPWEFGVRYSRDEAQPVLRGTVFADRGVYRLGEEVHLKAVLRSDTASGIDLLPSGTPMFLRVLDSRSKVVDRRSLRISEWSSLEWTVTLPADGSLGSYTVQASLTDPERPRPAVPAPRHAEEEGHEGDEASGDYLKTVSGSFLVAAYRRPDFRVDVSLSGTPATAGTPLNGLIAARYLFGAPMKAPPVTWTYRRQPLYGPPQALLERFADERFVFVGSRARDAWRSAVVASNEASLSASGELPLELETSTNDDRPYLYTLEGEVEDVSRQRIANRASFTVHPADFYVGVRRPPYFVDRRRGVETALVTLTPDGVPVPGVTVTVTITQVQYRSVRRAEGAGFYTWDTERSEEKIGTWIATTAAEPVPLSIPLPSGGYFMLRAEASDAAGRLSATELSFYGLGDGYTAWERFDHNRITLVPERATYKPGETARIMIQSPWEAATALVTTEREGIRSQRRFALTSTQQSIEVPVLEADIPNVYASVLLVKGRTKVETADDEGSDPGKPTFRLGYVELKVDDASRRLAVGVTASQEEYRPGASATVDVNVTDARGRPVTGEVTLWAVDYGVLSLTAFRTPDVLGSVYVAKALQVMTTDNRQRIVSRRVLTPKGADEGGGGGTDEGVSTVRKDFRVLAFWVGSVVTDARGRARTTVTLPESLTTYRIMAVAADKASRFGSAESEIRINKPVTLKAAFPRFLALGDRAFFGAVVTSQLRDGGTALVTVKSLDPDLLAVGPEVTRSAHVAAGGSAEFRFDVIARATGRARVQMTARIGDEGDAFEDVIPVEVLVSPETVAAYGETSREAVEKLSVPSGVVPSVGGLSLELSSTALVGLGEGARFLVEYPYGCAEQRGSRALALLLAADLGDAFRLPGIDPTSMKSIAQSTIRELEKYQCDNGGFAYWPGDCLFTSPYLTAYLLHVFRVADSLKYEVDGEMRSRAYTYLERMLAQPPPTNEGWWPGYTAWQAFAAKELVEGGRNQDSNLTRLYGYRDRMPVFALADLLEAMAARGEAGPRVDDLRRRVANAVLPEGGSAHVEELSDPYLLWFWNSNVRSTAIALGTLVRRGDADLSLIRPMVRWLMTVRKKGRWGNTQENAWAMEALVSYYRKFESEVPDFAAVVSLGDAEVARPEFRGRSTGSARHEVPMAELTRRVGAGSTSDLTFRKDGVGTLFYAARLRYASNELFTQALDTGFHLERSYSTVDAAGGTGPSTTTFKAGDLVRVTLTLRLTKERRFVAVTDPLPAGFEAVDTALATASESERERAAEVEEGAGREWWERGGFDHVERHDDRVLLFATWLSEGVHTYSYLARATTVGTFRTAPTHAEEMYEPEVFGRTATTIVEVGR